MEENEGLEVDDKASPAAASVDDHGLSAIPQVSAKTSSIISQRKILQSSWIQRLKPFGGSDRRKEEESIASQGHVWTHFSKDFSSSGKRINKSSNHSSSSLPDGAPSQTKQSRGKAINFPRVFSSNPVIPFVPLDENLEKSLHHGSSASSWASDGLVSQSAKLVRKEEICCHGESSGDPVIPSVPFEEIHSHRGDSGNCMIPHVPLEGNASLSSAAGLRTWNHLSSSHNSFMKKPSSFTEVLVPQEGSHNNFMKKPSSFTEVLVPSSQNKERTSAGKSKDPCEDLYTGACKSEDSSTLPLPQGTTCDKNTSTAMEGGSAGCRYPLQHPNTISKAMTNLKSVSVQCGENIFLAEAMHGQAPIGNRVQGNDDKQRHFLEEPSRHTDKVPPSESASCTDLSTPIQQPQEHGEVHIGNVDEAKQLCFLDEPHLHADKVPPSESASCTDFSTSIPQPEESLVMKQQNLKDPLQNSLLRSKYNSSMPLALIPNIANNDPNKNFHGVKENFGFLRFPRKSSSRLYDNSNNDRNMENDSAVKSDPRNQLQNAVETCSVGTSIIGGFTNQDTRGPGSRSDRNRSWRNNKFFSDDVLAATALFTDEPSLKEGPTRLTLPKNHPGDYWSEWMKIWEKSTTPMKHDVINVETEILQAGHIIPEYRKPNPKTPDIILDGENLGQFSTSNEQMYGKQSTDFPQRNDAILSPTEKRGHFFCQGASGSGRSKIGDLEWEQRITSNLQKSYTIKDLSKHPGGQAWIRRWCSSTSIAEGTDKIGSFIVTNDGNSSLNLNSLIERSNHKASQNVNISESKDISNTSKKPVKVPTKHTGSTSTRQAHQVVIPAYTSNVSELGDFVRSKAGQAMAMVGNTASIATLLQRNDTLSVWTCDITTPEMESGNDFTDGKFHLDMEDF